MAEIIKSYKQSVRALRFIGKKYGDSDRVNGTFGAKWGEWFNNGWFGEIEKQTDGKLKDIYEDGDAYIGLMRGGHGEPFSDLSNDDWWDLIMLIGKENEVTSV